MTPQFPEGSLAQTWGLGRGAQLEQQTWRGPGRVWCPRAAGGRAPPPPLLCDLIRSLAGGAGVPGESPGKAFQYKLQNTWVFNSVYYVRMQTLKDEQSHLQR